MAPGVQRSEAAGARMVPPREGNEARRDGRRGIGAPHSTGEAGESGQRDPVEGRGRRQLDPLEGQMANTPRLGPVSTKRQRIARAGQPRTGDGVHEPGSLRRHACAPCGIRSNGGRTGRWDWTDRRRPTTRCIWRRTFSHCATASSPAGTLRLPCDASTSRKGMAGRLDPSGFRRSRTRCCSGPS